MHRQPESAGNKSSGQVTSSSPKNSSRGTLQRVLQRWDMFLLCIVAVVNLNLLPATASNGSMVLYLWLAALIFFLLPQTVAVVELSRRYPNEGGIYLWSCAYFGHFIGFLTGWCYWANNLFYVPTLLVYLVGNIIFLASSRVDGEPPGTVFMLISCLILLWLIVGINIIGLRTSRWLSNLGGISTMVSAIVLTGLAALLWLQGEANWRSDAPSAFSSDWKILPAFGVVCLSLVGLELGSVMGDEIRESKRTIPWAVLRSSAICACLYVAVTVALLVMMPAEELALVQGILEALTRISGVVGTGWAVPLVGVLLNISVIGAALTWMGGSSRILLVAGFDHHIPAALGRLHPRFGTPYIALLLQGGLSSVILVISMVGASFHDAYLTMLDLTVVLQLLPYLAMFAGLILVAKRERPRNKTWVSAAGVAGLLTTAMGTALVFIPSRQINSIWRYEITMVVGCLLLLSIGAIFYWHSAKRSVVDDRHVTAK